MKSIEIRTTQNVTITYALADTKDRIFASVLDFVFKLLATYLLYLLFLLFLGIGFDNSSAVYFYFMLILPVNMFYTLILEYFFNGQTLGKMILGIKVIKLNGKQPEFYDYLIRWVFRIFDIFISAGTIAVMLVVSTEYAQRLGDMVSHCSVVRISKRTPISLKDILKIETRSSYEAQYPQIVKFREEDILLIKNTIERYNKFRNQAHRKAVQLLTASVAEKLGVEEPATDKIKFLKTLIKDYIVLTR